MTSNESVTLNFAHSRVPVAKAFGIMLRLARMTDIPLFFVVAFSRSEASELRAEVTIKVPSRPHAASLASHLADGERGAIALSRAASPSTTGTRHLEILARFGDVPDDHTLHRQFGDDWVPGRSGIAIASAAPFPRSMPQTQRQRDSRPRTLPIAAEAKPGPARARRYSRAPAWLAAAGVALCGSAALVIAANGAQREARLVELARPACEHMGATNEELHRLVKYGYQFGASKKEALHTVITLCQVISRK
jgi:hypothetical protein